MKAALVIGHKYSSKGACNQSFQLCEYDYNQKLVSKIVQELNNTQIDPIVIYRGNYRDLPDKINQHQPDIIISFHCNAFNTKASGTEVLYYYKSKAGKSLAKQLQKNIVSALGLPDRGIKGRATEDRGGYLLRYTHAPCLILEPFFIDNDADLATAIEKEQDLIQAVVSFLLDV